jgi:type VI secretion system protein ImpA
MGRFGLRDIQIASGELPAPKDGKTPPPEPQIIDAAFQDAALEQLQTVASAIGQSLETLTAIDATLLDRVGPEASPDLAALTDLITAAQKTIAPHLSQRLESAAPEDEVESSAPETENAMGDPSTTVKTPTPAGLKAINSRGDVIKAIDLICAYYAQHEPSSPIPILLERAKRLVAKDFMAILRDLAPEGIAQLEMIRGPETDD